MKAQAPENCVIVLYSRLRCHLCEEAEALIRSRETRYGLRFEKLYVDDDPALVQQYGQCVPVVLVDGKLRFRGRVEPALFDRIFAHGD